MSSPSQREWRSVKGVHTFIEGEKGAVVLTCDTPAETNLIRITATIPACKMQRHVQVTQEMNKELQCLVRRVILRGYPRVSVDISPVLQDVCDVSHSTQDVAALSSSPATASREGAGLGGVVVQSSHVVQRRGPPHLVPYPIGPRRDRR